MKAKLFTLIVVLVFLAGCEGVVVPLTPDSTSVSTSTATAMPVDPTPTQEVVIDPMCVGEPTEAQGFINLNDNNCLQFPKENMVNLGQYREQVSQYGPEGYFTSNWQVNVDGTPDPYCRELPPILWDTTYMGYAIQHGKTCGYNGWTQPVEIVNAGCHIIKVTGWADIVQTHEESDDFQGESDWPEWAVYETANYNYGVFATVVTGNGEGTTLPVHILTINGWFEEVMTVQLTYPGKYLITWGLMTAYPTADIGSLVTFTTFTVAEDLDGDHCDDNTPGI